MKKFLLTFAVLLPGLLAHSQEVEDHGSSYAEVTFVARAEYSNLEDGHHLGNSSLYALVDGAFSPKLSFSVSTHLLCSEPRYLYEGTGYSSTTNWLDWAFMSYDFGKVSFDFGKMPVNFGTWEMDGYDFDQYTEIVSTYWLDMSVYQWGGRLNWQPNESFSLEGHVQTSPFGERPFASGKYTFGLSSYVYQDWYEGFYAINLMQAAPEFGDGNCGFFGMGHKFLFGKWGLVWDSVTELCKGAPGSNMLTATCNISDKWSVMGRAAYERAMFEDSDSRFFAGIVGNWKPTEQLRIHALAAYDTFFESPNFNIGLTWKISL